MSTNAETAGTPKESRSAVTYEAIGAAVEALTERGDKITVETVRKVVRASNREVGPMLRKWREDQVERGDMAAIEVPDKVSSDALALIGRIWQEAISYATEGHETIRRALVDQRTEAEREQAELLERLDEIEAELDQARADLGGAHDGRTAAGARIVAMEREAAALIERVAAREAEAENAREVAKVAGERESSMRDERDEARRKIDAATTETNMVRTDLTRQLSDVRAKFDKQTDSLAQVQADLGGARSDLATERAQHGATRDKLADAVARAETDAETGKAALADMRAERDEVRRELAEARKAAEGVASKSAARADADESVGS